MIRINAQTSASAVEKYLFDHERADYYTDASEIIGNWGGKGAQRLGLLGTVDATAFRALLDNLHPVTGEQLTPRQKANRTVGWDITFDGPKSFSILYGLSGDERLLQAFRRSMANTMALMEDEVQTRVRLEGRKDEVRHTKEFAYAEFIHLTTRPVDGTPDPQLHGHLFVPNSTFDAQENRFKAIMFREVVERAPYYQNVFHSLLKEELQNLGLSISLKGIAFEVDGVPESAIERFSRRTDVIEAEARRRGITDPVEKAKLGAKTREAKTDAFSTNQLTELWLERTPLEELAAVRSVLAKLHAPAREQLGLRPSLRTLNHQDYVRTPESESPQYITATSKAESRPTTLTLEQEEAVKLALKHCFTNDSVVPEWKLRGAILHYGIEDIRLREVDQVMSLIPALIRRQRDGKELLSTKDILAEERKLVDWVKAGKGTIPPFAPRHRIRNQKLGADQQVAVRHVLESTDRVTGIEGRAGTGKTTLMKEVVEAIEAQPNQRVVILAPTASASRDILRNEGFAEADTVERWLVDEHWRSRVGKGEVLWIDEAGLLSNRDLLRLIELAEQRHSRLILTGDTRQHRAVRRGDTMRMLKEHADLSLALVDTVRRQQGPYKEAVEAFAEGELHKGFETLEKMGAFIELPNQERYAAVAQEYLKAQEKGTKLHIVSPTHREIRKVNNAIRDALYAQGKLRDAQPVEIFQPLHWNDAQKTDLRMYLPGQVVEMHAAAPHLRAGERIRIVGRERDYLRVLCEDGQTRKFDPSRIPERFEVFQPEEIAIAPGDEIRFTRNGKGRNGELLDNCTTHIVDGFTGGNEIRLTDGTIIPCDFKHMAHGYCGTSYMAQGKTAHRVIVVESQDSFAAGSREQWYVSISRGMGEVLVYTDDRENLFDAVQRSSQRMAALDLVREASPSLVHAPPAPEPKRQTLQEFLATTSDKELAGVLQRVLTRTEAVAEPQRLSEALGSSKPHVPAPQPITPEHTPARTSSRHQQRLDLEQEPELELDL